MSNSIVNIKKVDNYTILYKLLVKLNPSISFGDTILIRPPDMKQMMEQQLDTVYSMSRF